MLVSGLLVTVGEGSSPEAVAQALQSNPRVGACRVVRSKLAVSIEAEDPDQAEALVDELRQLDGVLLVDVVAVYFEEAIRGAA